MQLLSRELPYSSQVNEKIKSKQSCRDSREESEGVNTYEKRIQQETSTYANHWTPKYTTKAMHPEVHTSYTRLQRQP